LIRGYSEGISDCIESFRRCAKLSDSRIENTALPGSFRLCPDARIVVVVMRVVFNNTGPEA
jgi:hypothetical protein